MKAPWKPGRPIQPHEPLYDIDPAREAEKDVLTTAGYAVGITAAVVLVVWGVVRLLG